MFSPLFSLNMIRNTKQITGENSFYDTTSKIKALIDDLIGHVDCRWTAIVFKGLKSLVLPSLLSRRRVSAKICYHPRIDIAWLILEYVSGRVLQCLDFDGTELPGVLYSFQLPQEVSTIVMQAHREGKRLAISAKPCDDRHPRLGYRMLLGRIEGHDSLR